MPNHVCNRCIHTHTHVRTTPADLQRSQSLIPALPGISLSHSECTCKPLTLPLFRSKTQASRLFWPAAAPVPSRAGRPSVRPSVSLPPWAICDPGPAENRKEGAINCTVSASDGVEGETEGEGRKMDYR
ncbi:hypothetical protein ACOMHN_002608 [Nucella lapillus]